MKLKLVRGLLVCASVVTVLLVVSGGPAQTASLTKEELLAKWTSPNSASFNQWNSGRQNQESWSDYDFDWSTDYCSASPDEPLGFDFRVACWRHDFGYRNYSDLGQFEANKARLDNAFYYDLNTKCASYGRKSRSSCDALAVTYYEAVRVFGKPGGAGETPTDPIAQNKHNKPARTERW